MTVQDRAVCFGCQDPIHHDPIFAAPCDHPYCPSATFHGLCLMRWRECRAELIKSVKRWLDDHQEDS